MARQRCKACGRDDYWNFDVPDDVWSQIVPVELQNRVVCLGCFDAFAVQAGVRYAAKLREVCFAGDMAALRLDIKSAVDA